MAVFTIWGALQTTVVAVLVYGLMRFLLSIYNIYRIGSAINQFPQDPKHWLMGHLGGFPGFNEAGLTFLREKAARHPRYSAVWRTIFMPSLTVRHPETVKAVLKRSDPKPTASGFYKFGRPWLGNGLLLASGPKWSRNRKLLTPAFHFNILRPYLTVDNEACDLLLEKMGRYCDSGKTMEFYYNLSLCTLDILLRCAFSFQDDIQSRGENHPYVQAVGKLAEIWVRRTVSLLGQFDYLWSWTSDAAEFQKQCDYVRSLADSVIASRRIALAEGGDSIPKTKGKYLDFLDILLGARDDQARGLTDTEIRDEVATFMFGGHDTTASSVTWTLYELAQHQDLQERCRQEANEILADKADGYVEWEDLGKFKYLTQCIKEAQRLHTVVPFAGREMNEDLVLDGKRIPKGTNVEVQFYTLHHNPEVWEDSMKYDPDRFLPENIAKKDQYAFLPFSAGPRNCIGQHFSMQEQKVIISRLLRKFRLELDPTFKMEKAVGLVTRPKDGLKMRILPL